MSLSEAGAISSSKTGNPMPAKWQAILEPITPLPNTATFLMILFITVFLSLLVGLLFFIRVSQFEYYFFVQRWTSRSSQYLLSRFLLIPAGSFSGDLPVAWPGLQKKLVTKPSSYLSNPVSR